MSAAPLAGLKVAVHARGVAAAYAGRMLAGMGAEIVLVEPPSGRALRREPPFLPGEGRVSALFAYLSAGASSRTCDLAEESGRAALIALLAKTLGLPKSKIRIAAGETARLKAIVIQSDSPALRARLESWGDTP